MKKSLFLCITGIRIEVNKRGIRDDTSSDSKMNLRISDKAEEFRIEIVGKFMASSVADAATAWKAALMDNIPRRISVDITRMTGYDHAGYVLLREMQAHGTHIGAGTAASLHFLSQISGPLKTALDDAARPPKRTASKLITMQQRATASGE